MLGCQGPRKAQDVTSPEEKWSLEKFPEDKNLLITKGPHWLACLSPLEGRLSLLIRGGQGVGLCGDEQVLSWEDEERCFHMDEGLTCGRALGFLACPFGLGLRSHIAFPSPY